MKKRLLFCAALILAILTLFGCAEKESKSLDVLQSSELNSICEDMERDPSGAQKKAEAYFQNLNDTNVISDLEINEQAKQITYLCEGQRSIFYMKDVAEDTNGVSSEFTQCSNSELNVKNVYENDQAKRVLVISTKKTTKKFADTYDDVCGSLRGNGYSVTTISSAGVEAFREGLDKYDIVLINSHGSMMNEKYPTYVTYEEATTKSIKKYSSELNKQCIYTVRYGKDTTTYYAIAPELFSYEYKGSLPKSLIYSGSCYGFEDNSFSKAFIKAGAGVYLGYTDAVYCVFDRAILNTFITSIQDGKTVEQSYNDAISVNGDNDKGGLDSEGNEKPPAYFKTSGNMSKSYANVKETGSYKIGKEWTQVGDWYYSYDGQGTISYKESADGKVNIGIQAEINSVYAYGDQLYLWGTDGVSHGIYSCNRKTFEIKEPSDTLPTARVIESLSQNAIWLISENNGNLSPADFGCQVMYFNLQTGQSKVYGTASSTELTTVAADKYLFVLPQGYDVSDMGLLRFAADSGEQTEFGACFDYYIEDGYVYMLHAEPNSTGTLYSVERKLLDGSNSEMLEQQSLEMPSGYHFTALDNS